MAEAIDSGARGWPPNPWLSMWVRPRRTVRRILDTDADRHVMLLAVLSGMCSAFHSASNRSLGDKYPLLGILVVAIVVGSIGGIIRLRIWSWLLSWTGAQMGGAAEPNTLRTAIAWSNVPAVWSLLLVPIIVILFGDEYFTSTTPNLDASLRLQDALLAIFALRGIVFLWGFVLAIGSVSEAQGFGVWRAIGSLLLSYFIVLAVMAGVGLAFLALAG